MNDDFKKIYKFIRLFDGRPSHLTKYLMDNGAFTDVFKDKLLNNSKLNNIDEDKTLDFKSISEMDNYFQSFLVKDLKKETNLEKELNDKLALLIEEERFEEASNLRDYMNLKNIKIL
jgi:hypothetical protein